ncbi:nuclear transport factor 2 family protein [Gemmatimonas sp.]|jgi:hypothetical protein|uniref:nuclear transport factor 2 family protein n=1 Tax=Gemmatimonas sp. TaxID=1962908 RepID=UPI0039191F21
MPLIRPIRTRLATLLSATVLALPAPATAQAQPPASAEQAAVMTVVRALFDGMRAADSAVVRRVFDPRVRMITVEQRSGRPEVNVGIGADNFAKAVGSPHADVWDERIRNEQVRIDGTLASVWVDYAFFAGPRFSHCGVDHFLLVKNGSGEWKILELADTRRTTGCDDWKT